MKSILSVSQLELNANRLNDTTHERASKLFRENGALWIKNAIPRSLVENLAEAYASKYSSQSQSKLGKKHALVGDQRFMVTVTIESPFNTSQLYANPLLMPILKSMLGEQCVISSFGSVVTFPGAQPQPIHFDHPPLFESEEHCIALPPHAITLVVPLVDIDPAVGSTAIWEGSHAAPGARKQLHRLMEDPNWIDAAQPLTRLGDVYLMDYRVIHGGTENKSDHPRPILYLVYSRPWFRDVFNFFDQPPIEFAPGEFKKVPKELRRLFAGGCNS